MVAIFGLMFYFQKYPFCNADVILMICGQGKPIPWVWIHIYIFKILFPLHPVQRGWGGGRDTYFHRGPVNFTKMGTFMNYNTFLGIWGQ